MAKDWQEAHLQRLLFFYLYSIRGKMMAEG
jgi:hypothetical protein